jgi:hypothetical protein
VKPLPIPPIPEESARVARTIVDDDVLTLQVRDTLDTICNDEELADLYSHTGQPALAP